MQQMDRRQLLEGLGAIGMQSAVLVANVRQVSAQGASPRMALAQFMRDQSRVDALKRGVAVMKARKPSDPGSWFYQAAIHGVPGNFVREASRRDADVAHIYREGKFWNQCTHFRNASSEGAPGVVARLHRRTLMK